MWLSGALAVICLLSAVSRAELEKLLSVWIDDSQCLCGGARPPPPGWTRRVSCGFFGDATPHFDGVYACICGWLSVCIYMSLPPPHCVVWCVCERYTCVLWGYFNSVSISSRTWGSWWRSGTRLTLPTQHPKLLMSYCCTLLWNIIALWCVNKAGACCHSICSQAGLTGTTRWGEERGRKGRRE